MERTRAFIQTNQRDYFEKITIDKQFKIIVEQIIYEHGMHYKISLKEIYEIFGNRFQTNYKSIIPSDYCYNRVNKGIDFEKKPRLFSFHGNGEYECLGENYPFTGVVYTKEKGTKTEVEVGYWKNGVLTKNDNWNLYYLK